MKPLWVLTIFSAFYNIYFFSLLFCLVFFIVYNGNEALFYKFIYNKKHEIKGFKNYTIYSTSKGTFSFLYKTNKLHNEKGVAQINKTGYKAFWINGKLISDTEGTNIFTKHVIEAESKDKFDEFMIEYIREESLKQKINNFK
jgi:hypothetical protein